MTKYAFDHPANGLVIPVRLGTTTSVVPEIKPGYYTIAMSQEHGIHLVTEKDIKLPREIYGNLDVSIDRYFRSFELNDKNLGISLCGLKGSGKTLQAKLICKKAVEMGYPVILITDAIPANMLSSILNTIEQNAVVFIDEFDKLYYQQVMQHMPSEASFSEQEGFLSILDGVNSTGKKMFILTANESGKMSQYFKDRPSRIRYDVQFEVLPNAVLYDYIEKNLPGATDHDKAAFRLLKVATMGEQSKGDYFESSPLNFDTMKELIVEMKQFKETLTESWGMMKFGSTTPASYGRSSVTMLMSVITAIDGKYHEFKGMQNPRDETAPPSRDTFIYRGKLMVDKMDFHQEGGCVLRPENNGGYNGTWDISVLKKTYDYSDLLCYDRNYSPVYLDDGKIVCVDYSLGFNSSINEERMSALAIPFGGNSESNSKENEEGGQAFDITAKQERRMNAVMSAAPRQTYPMPRNPGPMDFGGDRPNRYNSN